MSKSFSEKQLRSRAIAKLWVPTLLLTPHRPLRVEDNYHYFIY
jgi:hypothetical protein